MFCIMWLFSFFFLPSILVLFFLTYVEKNKVFPLLLGLGCGAIYVFFAILFGSEYRIVPADFLKNFNWYFFQEVCLPTVLITFLFFLFFKESLAFKIDVLFFVLAGFYTLYIPFRLLFRSGSFSAFLLFFKPIFLTCSIIGFSFSLRLIYTNIKGDKLPLLYILPILLGIGSCVCPAIAEVIWFSGGSKGLWGSIVGIEIVFAFALVVLNHHKMFVLEKNKQIAE